jgi:hypothetical protein
MFAGEIVLSDDALVAGEVDIVVAAMKQIGIPIPPPIDYPPSLTPFLHRNIWCGQYGDLRRHLDSHFPRPVFAKPAGARKLFQGRVFRDIAELDRIANLPESTAILFSDVVPFISEFRFYVIRSRVVCCENYDGDPQDLVDESIVADAIATLDAAGQSFAAYAIDFGLLRTGETALVEMNDGFSVGTYREICARDYTDFTVARWTELLATRMAEPAHAREAAAASGMNSKSHAPPA